MAGKRVPGDPLTDVAALSAHARNRRALWRHGLEAADLAAEGEEVAEAIEARVRTGRPLATEEWIEEQERLAGRAMRRQKPGPKSKSGHERRELSIVSPELVSRNCGVPGIVPELPVVGIGHELGHSALGYGDPKAPTRFAWNQMSRNEQLANIPRPEQGPNVRYVENAIRAELGLPDRQYYVTEELVEWYKRNLKPE